MNRTLLRFLTTMLALCLAAAPGSIVAQQASALAAEQVKTVEDLISAEMQRQKIPGLSLAIAVDNRLAYSKGFGMADLENSVPVKATTAFRTASIAKPLTATGVMQLAEAGKLDLDAPVEKYCPAFPPKPWPVTSRQLLGHLGGVRHYQRPGEARGTEHFFTLTDSLRTFKDDPLLHEPGTRYFYSTYGFTLLGCVLEGAAGTTYEKYMGERVFAAAGMSRTQADNTFQIIPDRARGYTRVSQNAYNQLPPEARAQVVVGNVYNAWLHDTSMKIPGGGLVSTAEDLVRFALAFQADKLVKPETRQAMWARQKTTGGDQTDYGLGWFIRTADGVLQVSHSGGQAGTSCLLVILPEKKIVFAFMTNLDGAELGPIARGLNAALTAAN